MIKFLKRKKLNYTDAEFVEGMKNYDNKIQEACYLHLKKYFNEHYKGVFFTNNMNKDDIFQNSFITFWEIIEKGRIYVKENQIYGKKDLPLKGSLSTFFMSIASLKNLEWTRQENKERKIDDDNEQKNNSNDMNSFKAWLNNNDEIDMDVIISECIAVMSPVCNAILSKFYYENKNLDQILEEMPSIRNKDTLKTRKNKCLNTLRQSANNLYETYRKL